MSQPSARLAATFSALHAPEPAAPRPGQSLFDRIGNTPLLRFDQLTAHLPGVTLLGKAEWHNPGGSVKDRAAAGIVSEGRRSGKFSDGKILLDATSGNTAIPYALLVPPDRFPFPIRCVSLQPDSAFHRIEGAKHMATAIVPNIYDPKLADQDIEIATEDAYAMCRRIGRECGLLLGISAAAGIFASLRIAERLQLSTDQQAMIVTILCDSGEKYLSERFWTEG